MNDAERAEIHRLAGEGLSARAIARIVESSHPTILRVLAQAKPPLELPVHMTPAPLPSADAYDSDAPAMQVVRELLAQARMQFDQASQCGDSASAQRYARTAAGLMPVLARLEREAHEATGEINVSAADYAAACADLDAKLAARVERGGVIRCADCERALSIAFAGLGPDHV